MQKLLLCLVILLTALSPCLAEDLQKVISHYQPDMSKGLIYISKLDMTLTLLDADGQVVVTYPIACGKNKGHKHKKGDMRTPEGKFSLQQIQDAHTWSHDFGDGKGVIKGAYGPCFMRLRTGFSGIGIHGTHDPNSIGTRATEGCIRLENKNAEALSKQVTVGMSVIIGPENGVAMLKDKSAKDKSDKEQTMAAKTPAKAKEKIRPAKEKVKKPAKKEDPVVLPKKEYTQPAWCWPPLDSKVKE